jgi:hypothetical protein
MVQIAADGADSSSWYGSRPIARIAAGGADETPWHRSRPVALIADEHREGTRARMAVDGRESHLTEHDRSAYRPADHSRTISKETREHRQGRTNECQLKRHFC